MSERPVPPLRANEFSKALVTEMCAFVEEAELVIAPDVIAFDAVPVIHDAVETIAVDRNSYVSVLATAPI